ncbi:sulfur carrier protein ThiS [Halotalea alkalilenta]|uniref:Thiamine biosynthesis protein ThiS n=1 Tax=Halotalea alkalilenta TaxID=376489 RepID=A0A172YBT6_9GAMM|nr:sulfur carrier protein ThiS [Halotalea alkalilenta]ANF56709.1 thiamine biosynthesis protein ThiS [Halotalea alkalilenta]
MQLYLNGEPRTVEATTVAELVAALNLGGRRIAVERNERIVPRSKHADTVLEEHDRIEIVHAIGGG